MIFSVEQIFEGFWIVSFYQKELLPLGILKAHFIQGSSWFPLYNIAVMFQGILMEHLLVFHDAEWHQPLEWFYAW